MLSIKLIDIIKIAIEVKILLSKKINFALFTLMAIFLIKHLKAIYNRVIFLPKKIIKVVFSFKVIIL